MCLQVWVSLSHLTIAHRFHPPAGLSTCHGAGDSSSLEMTSQQSFPSPGSPEMGPAETVAEAAWSGAGRAPGHCSRSSSSPLLETWRMFSEYPLWQPHAQVLLSPDTPFGKLLFFSVLEKGPGIKGREDF